APRSCSAPRASARLHQNCHHHRRRMSAVHARSPLRPVQLNSALIAPEMASSLRPACPLEAKPAGAARCCSKIAAVVRLLVAPAAAGAGPAPLAIAAPALERLAE